MSVTLEALSVLDAIDRNGSFAAAAQELYKVPSAISYTVQKLEQDLDIAIFDRSGHRAVLTPAGRALLNEGRHLLHNVHQLESHVKRVATGWESELHIVVDAIVPLTSLYPIVRKFYAEHSGTRLFLHQEVLGGTWDALSSDRADIAIAASGDGPTGGGFQRIEMGATDMVFAVAPNHPLAAIERPLKTIDILAHRAVAVADSSRYLPARSVGLLSGQDVLTVADMRAKLEAQCAGLGVGYLPRNWIQDELADGRLVIKAVQDAPAQMPLYIVWHSKLQGRALNWFIDQFKKPRVMQSLLGNNPAQPMAKPYPQPALRRDALLQG